MDAVIFDVGGVLLVPHADAVSSVLRDFGIRLSPEQAEHAHYVAIRALDAAEDDPAGRRAYLDAYADQAGIKADEKQRALRRLSELWAGPTIDLWRQPVRGSVDGMRRLAATGRKLGIVSNADGSIEEQLRRNEICQVGEGVGVPVLAIIDSHIVGVAKPAADIFRHALEPLSVAPERAIYVGDTVRYDVEGARAAGLHPVHFDPYALCAARDDHAHVAALADLEDLLEKL